MLSRRVGWSFVVCGLAVTGACAEVEPETGQAEQHTAGSGIAASILANSVLGSAEVEVKWGGHVTRVEDDTRLVMQEITFQPGGHTGWHTHGGMAFASIVSGTLTLYSEDDPCVGVAYPAGTAFVDPGGGHTHLARNEGSIPMTVRVQYVMPNGSAVRIDAPAPAGACF